MTKIFDKIMDMGGNFEILIFNVGKKKTDPSYARLRVNASSDETLDSIISELHRYGAQLVKTEEIRLVAAEADRVVPKGFYSTTNHPTSVKYHGRMDSCAGNRNGLYHCIRYRKRHCDMHTA